MSENHSHSNDGSHDKSPEEMNGHKHGSSLTQSSEHPSEYIDEHSSGHSHAHLHTHTKAVLNRLSRAAGHLESVKRMVSDGRDCSEVLIQLAAVRSAIGSTAKLILKDHIEHCVVSAVESNDIAALEELNKAIELFLR